MGFGVRNKHLHKLPMQRQDNPTAVEAKNPLQPYVYSWQSLLLKQIFQY